MADLNFNFDPLIARDGFPDFYSPQWLRASRQARTRSGCRALLLHFLCRTFRHTVRIGMAESENAAHFSEISREEILTKAQLGGLTLQSGVDRGVHFTILEGASKEGRGKKKGQGRALPLRV